MSVAVGSILSERDSNRLISSAVKIPVKYRAKNAIPCKFTRPPRYCVSGINAAINSAYTGRRAEQDINGLVRMVSSRLRGDSMVRAAIMAGMAQACADRYGIKLRPDKPK